MTASAATLTNSGLMTWIKHFENKPEQVFVNHGEDSVCEIFAGRLRNELGLNATAPYNGSVYDLITGKCLSLGNMVKIPKKTTADGARSMNPVYRELLNAGEFLDRVIAHNEGGANKDLRAFTKELMALCEKWDR